LNTNTKPTCFISYCRDHVDRDSINYLVQELRLKSRNTIDFLYDEELGLGKKLGTFMELIRVADAVIILLTPDYKLRTEDRLGGVYKEYTEILTRYNNEININIEKVNEPTLQLLPIIFSGNFERSCPKELKDNLCLDFSSYTARKRDNDGVLFVTKQIENMYSKDIRKIVSSIVASNAIRSPEIEASFDELKTVFFDTTKHENLTGNPRFEGDDNGIFVKTYAYKKVKNQTSYLLIGRKGSGKSTIIDYLSRDIESKYNDPINININNFDLEYIYSLLTSRQTQNDLKAIITQVRFFESVWELFLYIICMNCILIESRQGRFNQGQLNHITTIRNFLLQLSTSTDAAEHDLDFVATFHWCYSKIIEQIEVAIKASRNSKPEFSYDLSRMLNPDVLLQNALKSSVLDAFNETLHKCEKSFLISLDGFDTAFEKFRISSQNLSTELTETWNRTRFEIDWLAGFTHVIMALKSSNKNTPLSCKVDFCATIPKDRFIEFSDEERDSYVYIGKNHEIRWSAIELTILLYKRLEKIAKYRTNRDNTPRQRLEEVLLKGFPYIPKETITTIDDQEYQLPIFIDVLRHSFWRPREMLIYFAQIIAVLKDMRRRDIDITQFTVSKCIADTTRQIIKSEFLSEFKRHCPNLQEIIGLFRRQKQILSYSDISLLIGGFPFKFIDKEEAILDIKIQLSFLYEIGFLGLEVATRTLTRLKLLNKDVFWFNAGDDPYEVLESEDFDDCQFVIHPVFCEYLDLDVKKQRLTMNFDWEYLMQQEIHVVAPS
jgi:Cdc6-like AAA superfamily ATPase